jgi:hypothetical protein
MALSNGARGFGSVDLREEEVEAEAEEVEECSHQGQVELGDQGGLLLGKVPPRWR